jgi:hypothetical protein
MLGDNTVKSWKDILPLSFDGPYSMHQAASLSYSDMSVTHQTQGDERLKDSQSLELSCYKGLMGI